MSTVWRSPKETGADLVINPMKEDVVAKVKSLTAASAAMLCWKPAAAQKL